MVVLHQALEFLTKMVLQWVCISDILACTHTSEMYLMYMHHFPFDCYKLNKISQVATETNTNNVMFKIITVGIG